ncbi:MAG: hypothetical protein SPL89_02395 [Clostridia bacterium]|nr:hypothetical protein [Clostridia bacterium]
MFSDVKTIRRVNHDRTLEKMEEIGFSDDAYKYFMNMYHSSAAVASAI